jgi:hypothetical protein
MDNPAFKMSLPSNSSCLPNESGTWRMEQSDIYDDDHLNE